MREAITSQFKALLGRTAWAGKTVDLGVNGTGRISLKLLNVRLLTGFPMNMRNYGYVSYANLNLRERKNEAVIEKGNGQVILKMLATYRNNGKSTSADNWK
jgi:hypothetical protein